MQTTTLTAGMSLAAAERMIDAAVRQSETLGVAMNIAVMDAGANLTAFRRMDGAWLGSIDIACRKARTARYFDMPTGAIGEARLYTVDLISAAPRLLPEQFPDHPDYDENNPGGGVGNAACLGRCTDTAGPIPPTPVLVFTDPDETDGGGGDEDGDQDPDACQGLSNVNLVVGTKVHNPNICTAPVLTYWVNEGEE